MIPNDYAGVGVHEAARVGAVADGDEILVTVSSLADASSFDVTNEREVSLKGLAQPGPHRDDRVARLGGDGLRYPGPMRIAFVSTYPPRRCGIATFTSDLIGAIREADRGTQSRVAAIDERNSVRAYGTEVRWRIRQGSATPYRAAARDIDRSNADVVCVQHEFGLYGLWKGGGFVGDTGSRACTRTTSRPSWRSCKKPALVTMHTVLPEAVARRSARRSARSPRPRTGSS